MNQELLQSLLATVPQEKPQRSGAAVVDGKIQMLSATQLQKALACMLQWWFRYVRREPEEKRGAADLGSKLHREAAHYLESGEDCLGPILRAGKHWMPLPGADLLVEERFDGQKPQGDERVFFRPETTTLHIGPIPVDGAMDWLNPRALLQPALAYPGAEEIDPAGTLEIGDHKTTGDVDAKAAKPAELASAKTEFGLQMIGIYGKWALQNRARFPGLQRVRLTHIYYQTKGRRYARRESVVVRLDQIESEWETVNRLVGGMTAAAREADPNRIPFDLSACKWCSYRNQCPRQQNLDPRQALFIAFGITPKGTESMSLVNDLLPQPPAPAALPPAAPDQLAQFQAWQRAQQAAAAAAPAIAAALTPPLAPPSVPIVGLAPPPPAPVPAGYTPVQPVPSAQPHPQVAAVLPPDAPPSNPALAAEPFKAPAGDAAVTGRDMMGNPIQGASYKLPTGHVGKFLCSSNGQNVFIVDGLAQPVPLPPNTPIEFIPGAPSGLQMPAPAAAAPPAEKPKRTRRTKEQIAADEAAAAAQAPAAVFPAGTTTVPAPVVLTAPVQIQGAPPTAQAPAPLIPATGNPSQSAAAPGGAGTSPGTSAPRFRLFIGCRPDAGAKRLDDYVRAQAAKILARWPDGVDIRVYPNRRKDGSEHPLAFGKWAGALAALCRESPPEPGDYFCTLDDELVRVAATELASVARPEDVFRAI